MKSYTLDTAEVELFGKRIQIDLVECNIGMSFGKRVYAKIKKENENRK
ncbi:MAG TPA: hypothetical protein VGB37_05250 [Candidatus Lokiarchaeia archaeon]